MTMTGTIKRGKVVLDGPVPLEDGARVEVRLVTKRVVGSRAQSKLKGKKKLSSVANMLLRHAGKITDLPPDFSRNHDHYIYGVPKKK